MAELYINFDEYIRQGEPKRREAAYAWSTAIGLQAVDGLKTSEYLQETARKHIEGDITIDEVRQLIKTYYESKSVRTTDDDDMEEADRVSANIVKVLSYPTFNVDNDLFAKHSWYFRNALVRANYSNYQQKILRNPSFLEMFFRNLLLGENNELRNRYMIVNPPKEWKVEQDKYPASTPQVPHKLPTSLDEINDNTTRVMQAIGRKQLSIKEILSALGLKDRKHFIEQFLNPAITEGYVRLLYPDKPRHPRQKYLLTVKGMMHYNNSER